MGTPVGALAGRLPEWCTWAAGANAGTAPAGVPEAGVALGWTRKDGRSTHT